jgi:hypothetical protein
MKKLLIVLLFIIPLSGQAQARLNTIDSPIIETKLASLTFGGVSWGGLSFNLEKKSIASKKKSSKHTAIFFINFIFKTSYQISTDTKCSAKIEFENGTVEEYSFHGQCGMYSPDKIIYYSIKIPENDLLYKSNITDIKIRTTSYIEDFEISNKKGGLVKDSLLAIKSKA